MTNQQGYIHGGKVFQTDTVVPFINMADGLVLVQIFLLISDAGVQGAIRFFKDSVGLHLFL